MLLGHSQGQAEKGTCGEARLIPVVHLVTWVGCSQLVYVGMLKQQETKYEEL